MINSSASAPLVSIVIPVYNGARYLEEAIISVFSQKYSLIELVILDNASTDNTQEIIQKAKAAWPERNIVTARNSTVLPMAENWNSAIKMASGEFIKLLPYDDLLFPNCVAEQVSVLQSSPGATFATCGKQLISPSGKPSFVKNGPYRGLNGGNAIAVQIIKKISNPLGEPAGGLFRKKCFLSVNFDPNIRYFTDIDHMLGLIIKGDSFYHINKPLYYYRLHGGSETMALRHAIADDFGRYLSKHTKALGISFSWTTRKYLAVKLKALVFMRSLVSRFIISSYN